MVRQKRTAAGDRGECRKCRRLRRADPLPAD